MLPSNIRFGSAKDLIWLQTGICLKYNQFKITMVQTSRLRIWRSVTSTVAVKLGGWNRVATRQTRRQYSHFTTVRMDFMSDSICVFAVGVSSKSRFDVDQPSVDTQKRRGMHKQIYRGCRSQHSNIGRSPSVVRTFGQHPFFVQHAYGVQAQQRGLQKGPQGESHGGGRRAPATRRKKNLFVTGRSCSLQKTPPMVGPLSQRRVFSPLITRRRCRSKLMAAKFLPCAYAPAYRHWPTRTSCLLITRATTALEFSRKSDYSTYFGAFAVAVFRLPCARSYRECTENEQRASPRRVWPFQKPRTCVGHGTVDVSSARPRVPTGLHVGRVTATLLASVVQNNTGTWSRFVEPDTRPVVVAVFPVLYGRPYCTLIRLLCVTRWVLWIFDCVHWPGDASSSNTLRSVLFPANAFSVEMPFSSRRNPFDRLQLNK